MIAPSARVVDALSLWYGVSAIGDWYSVSRDTTK